MREALLTLSEQAFASHPDCGIEMALCQGWAQGNMTA